MSRRGARGAPPPAMPTSARGQEVAEQGEGPHSHSPVPTEEEGVPRGFPPDGCVDAVVGDALPVGDQGLRVPRLQVGFSEEPVPVTWRGRGWRRGVRRQCPLLWQGHMWTVTGMRCLSLWDQAGDLAGEGDQDGMKPTSFQQSGRGPWGPPSTSALPPRFPAHL